MTPKSNYADKRDANEPEIVREFERLGYHVIRMPRTAGFDLLVIGSGQTLIVEVKNPEYSCTLTEKEIEIQQTCNRYGVNYHVISDIRQVGDIINSNQI